MTDHLAMPFADTEFHLLGDRAVYWPKALLLIIADLHLGKGDIFRASGIAVPSGGTAHDLRRLDRLLQQTAPDGLLILGDVLHGGRVRSRWRDDWEAFRSRWQQLDISAVVGNHDRALAEASIGIRLLDDIWLSQGIHFCHDAERCPEPSVGGHLHPVVRMPGELRPVPVFWASAQRLVLPAFSAFTGGYRVRAAADDRLWGCNGEHVVALPVSGRGQAIHPN